MRPVVPCRPGGTRSAIIAWALLAATSGAAAQPATIELVGGKFSESYLQHPTVSGNLLVGVRWRGQEGQFDPHSTGLQVSPATAGGTVCVDVASEDGRYAAENLYRIGEGVRGEALLAMPTDYEPRLVAYALGTMAVMIRRVASCDSAETGEIIPAILIPPGIYGAAAPAAGEGRGLVLDVNADAGKVTMQLAVPGGPDVRAECAPAGQGVQISFSTRCSLALPQALPAGTYKLLLKVRERFDSVETPFDLRLDGYK